MAGVARAAVGFVLLISLAAPSPAVGAEGTALAACDSALLKAEELLAQRRFVEARELLLSSAKRCPNDARFDNALGFLEDSAGRFQEAQQAYRRAIALDPRNPSFHDNLGASYFRSGNRRAGVEEFRRAIFLEPSDWTANLNLATDDLALKDYEGALKYFRAARVEQSRDPLALLELTRAYLGAGNWPEAREIAKRVSGLSASDATIHFSLGLMLAESRHYSMAEKEFAAIPPGTRDFACEMNLGMTYSRLHQPSNAHAAFRRAMRLDPSSPEPYFRLGLEAISAEKSDDAIEWISEAHRKAPERPDISYALAEELIRARQYERAKVLLASASGKAENAVLWKAWGDLSAAQHDDPSAVEAYRHCLQLAPGRGDARVGLARVYIELHQDEEARRELEKTLATDPENADAKAELGRMALDAGQADAALKMTQQALTLDARNPTANENLARIDLRRGRLNEAIARLTTLIRLDPQNSRFHYLRGQVLLKLHRPSEAKAEFDLSIRKEDKK